MIEPKINKIDKSTFQITDKNNIIYGYLELLDDDTTDSSSGDKL